MWNIHLCPRVNNSILSQKKLLWTELVGSLEQLYKNDRKCLKIYHSDEKPKDIKVGHICNVFICRNSLNDLIFFHCWAGEEGMFQWWIKSKY